jgi:hypothetical protein
MTEHLPECLVPDFEKGLWICICNQLRACEQRVLGAAALRVEESLKASQGINDLGLFDDGTGSEDASERAYHRGLRDARALVMESR